MDMVVHRFNDRIREGLSRIVTVRPPSAAQKAAAGEPKDDGAQKDDGAPRLVTAS
jgi:hypothetical protein